MHVLNNPSTQAPEAFDEHELIRRAQAGDAEAFSALCRLLGDRLVRQATLLCGERTFAEDLAQETLVQAWKGLRRYNHQCRFFTWLCAILLNRYRSSHRRHRPIHATALRLAEETASRARLGEIVDDALPPDRAIDGVERAAFIRSCVERLAPKHREVIHLRFYVDHSLEGIAAALGCSLGTVKSRLFHALDRLRAMKKAGLGEHLD